MYESGFYKQQEGAAMGSPVSAVIPNLYMETFQKQALQSCNPEQKPRVLKGYVVDTFVVVNGTYVDNLLNSQQDSIHFTIETRKDNKIAFLDMLVHRDPNGHLYTSI